MQNVLLVVHLIACIALTISVLLQRSEGGALGMGGGGTGGVISGRGAASVLVRTTMVLAATFIFTSIFMTRLNAADVQAPTDLERELQQRQNNGFDPLAPTAPPAGTTTTAPTTTPSAATPGPAPIDPLAPVTGPTTTAPTITQPPPAAATPAPAPARPAVTTTPPAAPPPATTATTPAAPATNPATPPETGGSNTP